MADSILNSKLRVYLDGTMIVFADENGIEIASEPRGTISVVPVKTGAVNTGFTFTKRVTGEYIGGVKGFADVLDGTGAAYGASFAAVSTALNAFLGFSIGGGSGVTGAANGLYLDGSTVKMGTVLVENTAVTEDGFDFSADKTENTTGYGDATTYYKSIIFDQFGDGDAVVRKFETEGYYELDPGIPEYDQTAELGVADDAYSGAGVFAKTHNNITNSGTDLLMRNNIASLGIVSAGVMDVYLQLANNNITLLAGTSLFSMIKGGAISLLSSNQPIFFDFSQYNKTYRHSGGAQVQTIEVPFDITLVGNTYQTAYTLPINVSETIHFEFEALFRVIGQNGSGEARGFGGGYRNAAGGAALTSLNPQAVVHSALSGAAPGFSHAVSGNNYLFTINPMHVGNNVRFVGTIKITKFTFS